MIDAGKKSSYKKHIELAKKYAEEKNLESPVYYAVSYQSMEIKDIDSKTPEVISEGGFNTAYTVEKIFSSVPQGKFPVIIMVTDNMNRVVEFEKTQLAKVFPENDYYYRLNSDLSLIPFDFYSNDILQETDEIITNTAVNFFDFVLKIKYIQLALQTVIVLVKSIRIMLFQKRILLLRNSICVFFLGSMVCCARWI